MLINLKNSGSQTIPEEKKHSKYGLTSVTRRLQQKNIFTVGVPGTWIKAGSRENYPAASVIFPAVKASSHLKKDLLSLLNVSRGISAIYSCTRTIVSLLLQLNVTLHLAERLH